VSRQPGAEGPSLGVVVTNYRTWELTRRCVEAVASLGGAEEVVVVDDGSPEPPPPGLDERARVLVNAANQGLCRSLNRGVRECAADVVVLFDSDAYPLVEFAAPLRAAFAADPQLAVVGFATVGAGGQPTGSWEQEPGVLGFVLGPRLDVLRRRLRPPRRAADRLSVFTCAMAVRRDAFLAIGGFDEAFDWLDLDHDLSLRLRGAGYRLAVRSDLVAFHEGGGAPQATSERVLRAYSNRWRLLRKHGKIRRPALVGALVRLRLRVEWLALRLASAVLRRRRDLAEKAAGRRALLRWCAANFR
jgi:GT2 family glycosyltransferase